MDRQLDCIDTRSGAPLDWRGIRRTSPSAWLAALVDGMFAWQERRRSLRLLQQLDDRMLRDMGLSRADVERECGKSLWRR
jgi:uncharacterized protein YjiS (DUF1127 family)